MKFFELKRTYKIGDIPIPSLNGVTVNGYENFFYNGCTIESFYSDEQAFNYLTPMYRGEVKVEPEIIADYHAWVGKEPSNGYFRPVSEKLKQLLEEFNLGKHKFYPAEVLLKEERHPYHVLHLLYNSFIEYIDFSKTVFNNLNSFGKLSSEKFEQKQFESFEEMEAYSDEHWSYNWNYDRLVMKSNFRELDYCYMLNIDGDLISERLKERIEQDEITGIKIEQLPIPIEFSDEV